MFLKTLNNYLKLTSNVGTRNITKKKEKLPINQCSTRKIETALGISNRGN